MMMAWSENARLPQQMQSTAEYRQDTCGLGRPKVDQLQATKRFASTGDPTLDFNQAGNEDDFNFPPE
jgi:hypothetical protein